MPQPVLVAGARTPIGRLVGSLSALPAAVLGGVAVRAALTRAGTDRCPGQGRVPRRMVGSIDLQIPGHSVQPFVRTLEHFTILSSPGSQAGEPFGEEPPGVWGSLDGHLPWETAPREPSRLVQTGSRPTSHRGGHWFDPSIAHQVRGYVDLHQAHGGSHFDHSGECRDLLPLLPCRQGGAFQPGEERPGAWCPGVSAGAGRGARRAGSGISAPETATETGVGRCPECQHPRSQNSTA